MDHEDALQRLKHRLNRIIELYQIKFSELHNKIQENQVFASSNSESGEGVDADLELHLAIAIYLATHVENNRSVRQYYEEKKDVHLEAFIGKIFADDSGYDCEYRNEMDEGVERYQADMKRIVSGDTRLQVRMLSIRKFFSVPWLVCVDSLIGNLK